MKKGVDYIGVSVGAGMFNKKGEVFLSKRGRKATNEKGFRKRKSAREGKGK